VLELLTGLCAVASAALTQAREAPTVSDAVIALDDEHRVVTWNPGAEAMYGYSRREALGRPAFALLGTQFVGDDGRPLAVAEVCGVAATTPWEGEARERRVDGAPLTVLSRLTATPAAGGFLLVNRDVTDVRRPASSPIRDRLTGLPNGRMLTNHLYDAYARACRSGRTLAVLLVDLVQFRMMNDVYGRAAADEVLRATGQRIADVLRGGDVVGRVHGDGFAVVLENAGTELDVELVAERITRSLVEPIWLGEDLLRPHATIGAVLLSECGRLNVSPERLVELANDARHMAKAAGTTFTLQHLTPAAPQAG
jgi:diguanylate cyclase (GGDEF)-like protein/PAS domain S-box-containing protein